MRLSSITEIISEVLSPRNNSSPLFLKLAKANSRRFQSATTPFNFASISFSLVAAMQISYVKRYNITNNLVSFVLIIVALPVQKDSP